MQWTKQRDEAGIIHLLEIRPDLFIKVEQSAAQDYFLTVYQEGDPCGGDIQYFETLRKAKQFAQDIANSGEWLAFTL